MLSHVKLRVRKSTFRPRVLKAALSTHFLFAAALASKMPKFEWSDPKSGRHYELQSGLWSWQDAIGKCFASGMVLFDLRYISDEERNAFMSGPMPGALVWSVQFAGTKGELSATEVWQSAQVATVADNAVNYASSLLVLGRKNAKMQRATELKSATGHRAHAICMSVEVFWHRCSVVNRCIDQFGGGRSWLHTKFVDYGASENEARQSVLSLAQSPRWAISENKCSVVTDSMNCSRVLPVPRK